MHIIVISIRISRLLKPNFQLMRKRNQRKTGEKIKRKMS